MQQGEVTNVRRELSLIIYLCAFIAAPALAQDPPPGGGPNLGERIIQEMVEHVLSFREIRKEGLRIFSTPFNRHDGLGDGPMDPLDPVSLGGRPTLQNNGMFLRMNGLDSQTCLECHSVLSSATIPATFAVGGAGGAAASAFPGVVDPDIDDTDVNGFADIRGRMINPPFNFGSGGVELVAREMTAELQELRAQAEEDPLTVVDLVTKGVSFGTLVFVGGEPDFSGVEGIDEDLVVRPFGRKGCCFSVRDFDIGAMQFHHGIQPVEVVGDDVDGDGDGVENELTVGELSALHIFQVSLERPRRRGVTNQSERGEDLFEQIGCASCHIPEIETNSRYLDLSFPEVSTDPIENVYFTINLAKKPAKFKRSGRGIVVRMFADLKRHDMGPDLAESTGDAMDPFFTTARLWGVADTAPYVHDGRAATLTEAILLHGGEAEDSRDDFDGLTDWDKEDLLTFLRTLRTPRNPNRDLRQRHEGN